LLGGTGIGDHPERLGQAQFGALVIAQRLLCGLTERLPARRVPEIAGPAALLVTRPQLSHTF
jgi:hypothetical protein